MEGTFREWLGQAIADGGVTKHGLAKTLARRRPHGPTPETWRNTLGKILRGKHDPSDPIRDEIAEALGRSDHPRRADEDGTAAVAREFEAGERGLLLAYTDETIASLSEILRHARDFRQFVAEGVI